MLGDFAFFTVAVSAIIGSNALVLEKACFPETETIVRHLQPLSNKHFSDHFSFQGAEVLLEKRQQPMLDQVNLILVHSCQVGDLVGGLLFNDVQKKYLVMFGIGLSFQL